MLSPSDLLNWKFTSELSFRLDNISYNYGHVNINMFKISKTQYRQVATKDRHTDKVSL